VDYSAFATWFDTKRSRLKIPADCSDLFGPRAERITMFRWRFEWALSFQDQKYIRIWEQYDKAAGLAQSQRVALSYHYGALANTDADGKPVYHSHNPVDIRIDVTGSEGHLHWGAPSPHISQDRIKNLKLNSLGMFDFLRAVFKHRATGQGIDILLRFEII